MSEEGRVSDVVKVATAIALVRPDLAYKGGGHRAFKALDAILNGRIKPKGEWGEFTAASDTRAETFYDINVRPGEEACQCEEAEWGGRRGTACCYHIVSGWIMMALTGEYAPPIMPTPKPQPAEEEPAEFSWWA